MGLLAVCGSVESPIKLRYINITHDKNEIFVHMPYFVFPHFPVTLWHFCGKLAKLSICVRFNGNAMILISLEKKKKNWQKDFWIILEFFTVNVMCRWNRFKRIFLAQKENKIWENESGWTLNFSRTCRRLSDWFLIRISYSKLVDVLSWSRLKQRQLLGN